MIHGQKKVIITISVVALISVVVGWFFVYQNNLPRQLVKTSETQNSPDVQNGGEELSATTHIYGQLIDKDGDPVLDEVMVYFVNAQTAPEGEITSIEGSESMLLRHIVMN